MELMELMEDRNREHRTKKRELSLYWSGDGSCDSPIRN